MRARSDSLAAELVRKKKFDAYFAWCSASRPSMADRLKQLADWGINTTHGSIHRLHRSGEALAWRLTEATAARQALDKMLPSDMDAAIKESLLRQRFDSTLGELSHKELMDHLLFELEERKIRLKEKVEPQKLELAERRVRVLEEKILEAKTRLEKIKSKGGLTKETLAEIEAAANLL